MSCFLSLLCCISEINLEEKQRSESWYRNQAVRHQYLLSCDPSGNIRKKNYNTTPRNNCYFGTGCSDYLFLYGTVPMSEQFRNNSSDIFSLSLKWSAVGSRAFPHNDARTICRSGLMTQNPVAALPVPSGAGTGVAAAHAEHAVWWSTFSLPAMFLVLVVASSSTAWSTASSNSRVQRHRGAPQSNPSDGECTRLRGPLTLRQAQCIWQIFAVVFLVYFFIDTETAIRLSTFLKYIVESISEVLTTWI